MRRFTGVSILVLVGVLAAVAIAAVLLAETVSTAQSINGKAQNIAHSATGINADTKSVMELYRTNQLALSILHSAKPLQGELAGIVNTAGGINTEASSINGSATTILGTAQTINSTAGTINSTAQAIGSDAGNIDSTAGAIASTAGAISSTAGKINGSAGAIKNSAVSINSSATTINNEAGSILNIAGVINHDVRGINSAADEAIVTASSIKGGSANILATSLMIRTNAACIDVKVKGSQSGDNQCQGFAATQTRRLSSKATARLKTLNAPRQNSPTAAPSPSASPAPAASGAPSVQGSAPSSQSTPSAPQGTQTTPATPANALSGVQQLVNALF
ncbi:MAG: hypothetical protein M3071_21415 [Actinomycetota bacterium]|nr:hypothetical protein [Actinomycetota bacterium]